MYATQAILAALLERELGDGTGQKIDVSLLDGQAAWTSYMAANYFASGEPPGRMGSKHPNIAPYQAFETRDGYVVVACASDAFWPRLCGGARPPPWPTTGSGPTRSVRNRDALDPELDAAFADLTTQDALDRLDEHGVPASPVRDMAEVFDDPQLAARNIAEFDHPTAGPMRVPGSPMHFSRTPTTVRQHPPSLGEHTEAVLREYGYGDGDLNELKNGARSRTGDGRAPRLAVDRLSTRSVVRRRDQSSSLLSVVIGSLSSSVKPADSSWRRLASGSNWASMSWYRGTKESSWWLSVSWPMYRSSRSNCASSSFSAMFAKSS